MKKTGYMMAHLLVGILLIGLGYLVETLNTTTTDGSATALMIVPGIVILLCLVLEQFRIKGTRLWMYVIVYGLLIIAGDLVAFKIYNIQSLQPGSLIAIGAVDVLTLLICGSFHEIYTVVIKNRKKNRKNRKKPG